MFKTILKKLNWNFPIRFLFTRKFEHSGFHPTLFGDPTIFISRQHKKDKVYYHFLHECLHIVIESKYSEQEREKFFGDLMYTREYKVESKLREICRKNNWDKLLKYSDEWLKEFVDSDSKDPNWQMYIYAANRITKEEKDV